MCRTARRSLPAVPARGPRQGTILHRAGYVRLQFALTLDAPEWWVGAPDGPETAANPAPPGGLARGLRKFRRGAGRQPLSICHHPPSSTPLATMNHQSTTSDEVRRAKDVFDAAGADDITTASTSEVHANHT